MVVAFVVFDGWKTALAGVGLAHVDVEHFYIALGVFIGQLLEKRHLPQVGGSRDGAGGDDEVLFAKMVGHFVGRAV